MVSSMIKDFIAKGNFSTPCIILDVSLVERKYLQFIDALPKAKVYYAVKANPHPAILQCLSRLGSSFDTASIEEIELVLAAGAPASSISYGNTIKKEADISKAYALGVRLFAADCPQEIKKIARAAPGAKVFCRILVDGSGAEWPLTRKFGCQKEYAVETLLLAKELGLTPVGVSFHVGSQQTCLASWDSALAEVAWVFEEVKKSGLSLNLINLGGGFPIKYVRDIPSVQSYADAINGFIAKYFGGQELELIIEPGRGMVGDCGVIVSEIVLISKKSSDEMVEWLYLDCGKFNGLIETLDESIRYKIIPLQELLNGSDGSSVYKDYILAGPTCDSADILYEKAPYPLPSSIQIGDKLVVLGAGAYTSSYASVAFNGFPPIPTYLAE